MCEKRKNRMAYFAGTIDGDGSFSLCKKMQKEGRSPLYYPLIQLSTTYFKLIDMLVDEFGGSVSVRKSYTSKSGSKRKESKSWKLEKSGKCLPFLEKIVPFLMVKKQRGQFLMDYIKNNPFVRGSRLLSNETIKNRDSAYIKMQQFNRDLGKLDFKFPRHRKTTDDSLFWNYFAGLMDTDGSFSIKREKTERYSPMILLTMIDHRAFDYIVKNFELGRMMHVKASTARNGYCYRFGIYSVRECLSFLELIIPFMHIKKEQASILYEYCKSRIEKSIHDVDGHEYWYQKIRSCNNGVYKPSLIDLKLLPGSAGDNKAEAGVKPGTVNVVSEKAPLNKGDAVL